MEKTDILHLGRLARIKIHDEEIEGLKRDITAVLDYVSVVNEIASAPVKAPGALYNVFRSDEVNNAPGAFTATLLAEAPKTERNMLVVKKILSND